ncbi:MAG TPA: anaerobic ribonucleoside-triphosphate reductase [Spirochaetota bacterium]|nr:anaerobic ribonucleoside-triphosphate reductase [Spirochaetota bacterium]
MNTRTNVSKQSKVIPVEVYSRVVGYYRPTNQWNPGKKAEFDDREFYNVNDSFV